MRALTILTAAVLTIALSTSAEARKRGLSLGSSPAPIVRPASAATPAAAPTRPGTPILFVAPRTGTPMPVPAATAAGVGAAAGAVVGAGVASAASAGPPPPLATMAPVTPAATRAGCPSENVIGRGVGFCALN